MLTRVLWSSDPISAMSREMDRLFESMASGVPVFRPMAIPASTFPLLNIWHDEENVYAEAELPGLTMNDVEVFATPGTLTIKGSRQFQWPNEARVIRGERRSGQFERSFQLPCEIDVDAVTASLRNGVLTVKMPKAASSRTRKIAVESPALPN